MNITRRDAALALAAGTFQSAAWAQGTGQPAEIPVEAFFERARMTQAVMNPSGTHVALCVAGGEAGRPRLGVVDLATMKVTPVAAYDNADVTQVRWVNDSRLIYFTQDDENWRVIGYSAVDANGENLKDLRPRGLLLSQGSQIGDDVLMTWPQDYSEGPGFFKLVRLNTVTGKQQELDVPPWSVGFMIDHRGELVAAVTARGGKARFQWREGEAWRVVREMDRFFGEGFAFAGMSPQGTVYVTARRDRDQTELFTFDPATGQLSDKPVLGVAQFDLNPQLVFDERKLLGMHLLADAQTSVWLDDELKALQAKIDARLRATTNVLSPPRRGKSPWILVWAYSDRQPALALLYHRETDQLSVLGRSRPQIDPARMSGMAFASYTARDGRRIPAYLTLPRGAGDKRPLPMVVLVHGGPFVRGGSWAWQSEVQFLASRGYAVLQPEFRGSTGFGDSHFKAGWKQWGQAMQDDLADAARWAIAQGVADPQRIAIAGASYGGYAAMMGLARQSDLFACAVNWVGVTDLDLMFGAHWSDLTGAYKDFGMPKLLGDRKADAEMLKANSPVHLASRIRKPVLMAYGKRDQRVPIEHGERMRDALEPHNKQVEWVVYDDEGHGWYYLRTAKDFWTRVERFLAKHLAAPA